MLLICMERHYHLKIGINYDGLLDFGIYLYYFFDHTTS